MRWTSSSSSGTSSNSGISFAGVATAAMVLALVTTPPSVVSSFSAVPLSNPQTSLRSRTNRRWRPRGENIPLASSWVTLRGGSDAIEPVESAPELLSTTSEFRFWKTGPAVSEPYYLVWSKGFLPKLALYTALLTIFRRLGWDQRVLGMVAGIGKFLPSFSAGSGGFGIANNVLLPLLSSSCCAIQLAVNAISIALGASAGCLGFNTYLGPLRPFLLAIMVAYHTTTTTTTVTATASLATTMLLRYVIALLPEMVFVWNDILRNRWKSKAAAPAGSSSSSLRAKLVVEVPTMGCVACVNKIESSLRKDAPNHIESASAFLNDKPKVEGQKKGGRVEIQLTASSNDELDHLSKTLVGTIETAGFGGSTIESLDVPNANE